MGLRGESSCGIGSRLRFGEAQRAPGATEEVELENVLVFGMGMVRKSSAGGPGGRSVAADLG